MIRLKGKKGMETEQRKKAVFHLPGLFEFYGLYSRFLPLYEKHREYFYDWCTIGSLYGAPAGCLWSGGRCGEGHADPRAVLDLCEQYGISARLTFSNSLLKEEHLSDPVCSRLCQLFDDGHDNSVIVHSDLLLQYLKEKYPSLYFVSSTTKVLLNFDAFHRELERPAFRYTVIDFRLNKAFEKLFSLSRKEKEKTEFLCNECCYFGCKDRKRCYEAVSQEVLGIETDFHCSAPGSEEGYVFSKAMENPGFISVEDIQNIYLPAGFTNFKIEGRSLGSAVVLEFLLYYLVRPSCRLKVREAVYLTSTLDLF